jgi:hypothetical protein
MPDDVGRRDLADPTPWRRSLRASTQRRAAVAVRRRRVGRSRGAGLAVVAALAVGASGAFAADASPTAGTHSRAAAGASTSVVRAAQQALGITADGIAGPQTRRAVRAFQRAHGLTADGVLGPKTLGALGVSGGASLRSADAAPAVAARTASAGSLLEAIALCESGGDPTAVSPSGTYRGKYQFDRGTWRSLGGKGDPAAAPERLQDRLAAKLYARAGTTPWPNCA